MKNKIVLSSLALDLKRIALALYHQSFKTADKFSQEALLRIEEINTKKLPLYIKKIISDLKNHLGKSKNQKTAEDFLMYSTIIQNYCLIRLK